MLAIKIDGAHIYCKVEVLKAGEVWGDAFADEVLGFTLPYTKMKIHLSNNNLK